jgi:hypothetical protein
MSPLNYCYLLNGIYNLKCFIGLLLQFFYSKIIVMVMLILDYFVEYAVIIKQKYLNTMILEINLN